MSPVYTLLCALESCRQLFCTTRRTVKYHSEKCARKARMQRFTASKVISNSNTKNSSSRNAVEKSAKSPSFFAAKSASLCNKKNSECKSTVQKSVQNPVDALRMAVYAGGDDKNFAQPTKLFAQPSTSFQQVFHKGCGKVEKPIGGR